MNESAGRSGRRSCAIWRHDSMHKAVPIVVLAALLTGCGDNKQESARTPAATATAAASAEPLAGYSEGVRKYYAGADPKAADDPNADPEVKYFQPPRPAETGLGGTITLTGANIGVKVETTVEDVKTVESGGKRYTAVGLKLKADGIAQLNSPLESAD